MNYHDFKAIRDLNVKIADHRTKLHSYQPELRRVMQKATILDVANLRTYKPDQKLDVAEKAFNLFLAGNFSFAVTPDGHAATAIVNGATSDYRVTIKL